jgi:hypothetical protein
VWVFTQTPHTYPKSIRIYISPIYPAPISLK